MATSNEWLISDHTVMHRCASCGRKNRVPAEHLTDRGKCGQCGAVLAPLSIPLDAGSALFDDVIQHSKKPVLVDFWAGWCGPCRMVAPEVEAAAKDLAGRAVVLKVDTQHTPELAARHRIQSIPTFVVYREGTVARQEAGAVDRRQLRAWVEQPAAA